MIDANARQWHWRTWNLLLQIQEATDGEDCRQKCGEMTERNLCVPYTPQCRALATRGWIVSVDAFPLISETTGVERMVPAWVVTRAGRRALDAARAEGITLQ